MNTTAEAIDLELLTAADLTAHIVREAAGAPLCLTSSFQTEDMVVLHLLRQHVPDVPVIFLETGYHFPELLAYRDRLVAEWNLNLINALPVTTLAEHEAQHGLLHIVQPTQCCAIRKVEPLMRSLEPFDWWFTGLRREQSPTRANLKKIEDHTHPHRQADEKSLHPRRLDHAAGRSLRPRTQHPPPLALRPGYTSIGCQPCTAIPAAGADPRSGRWGGNKLECGIHTFTEKA